MGIKDFFRKVGNGIRKAGRWVRNRALPAVGRIAKPILNMIGARPGHNPLNIPQIPWGFNPQPWGDGEYTKILKKMVIIF